LGVVPEPLFEILLTLAAMLVLVFFKVCLKCNYWDLMHTICCVVFG